MKNGKKWAAWCAGAVALAGWFLIVEMPAVFDPAKGDTLSEWVWYLMDTAPGFSLIFTIFWLGFVGWLTVHFLKRSKW